MKNSGIFRIDHSLEKKIASNTTVYDLIYIYEKTQKICNIYKGVKHISTCKFTFIHKKNIIFIYLSKKKLSRRQAVTISKSISYNGPPSCGSS